MNEQALYNGYFARVLEYIPSERCEVVLESIAILADAIREFNQTTGCCQKRVKS